MLSDSVLLRIAVGVSLVGLFALVLVLRFAELPVQDLNVVAKEAAQADARVRVRAEVVSVRHGANGTVTILRLAERVERSAVVFENLSLSPGTIVEIEGDVQEYQGAYELIVRSLHTIG